MYLELYKRGIRDVMSLEEIIKSYFNFLICEDIDVWEPQFDKGCNMIAKLERPHLAYFLVVFGEKRVKTSKVVRKRLKVALSIWVEDNEIWLGTEDKQKCLEELCAKL